jgi:hypothetical protein
MDCENVAASGIKGEGGDGCGTNVDAENDGHGILEIAANEGLVFAWVQLLKHVAIHRVSFSLAQVFRPGNRSLR